MIFFVVPQMLCQVINPVRKDCNLYLSFTCILGIFAEFLGQVLCLLLRYHLVYSDKLVSGSISLPQSDHHARPGRDLFLGQPKRISPVVRYVNVSVPIPLCIQPHPPALQPVASPLMDNSAPHVCAAKSEWSTPHRRCCH